MQALSPKSRVALVCRGGPENGPFSATVARVIYETLGKYNINLSAIYASSGSTPTALLGCTGDFPTLCDTWENLTPLEVVGKTSKPKTILRVISKESILTSYALGDLIRRKWNLSKIFSTKAIDIKFPAVDFLSTEYIIFWNKNPKHQKWFDKGVLGSMGLVPFLQPQIIYDPEESELIEAGKARIISNREEGISKAILKGRAGPCKALLLIDGGYKGNMLLEEAMRDYFDFIFLIDIHGLKPTETDIEMRYHWTNLVRGGLHILSNANDVRQYQITDRINEEIRIKKEDEEILEELFEITKRMPKECGQMIQPVIDRLSGNITRMNEGRLRLGDKNETRICLVSNEKYSTLFNFAKFDKKEVSELMNAGREAAKITLAELGFNDKD